MPVLGNQEDRLCDLIEELLERSYVRDAIPPEPPVVNVDAPTINVEAKAPAPIVNVAPPASPKARPWTMTVHRGTDGLIQTITVTPS